LSNLIANAADVDLDRRLIMAVNDFSETVQPMLKAQSDPDATAIQDPDFDRASLDRETIAKELAASAEEIKAQTNLKPKSPINLARNPLGQPNASEDSAEQDDEGTTVIPH
jgi:hypothetical protein